MLIWKKNYHQNIDTLYRLDFSPPEVILSEGFKGTNSLWMNNIFGEHTVFASKSLRGISRFFLESVLNKHVDGSNRSGALSSKRALYPSGKKCYVYKINATALDVVDVAEDLKHVLSQRDTSRLYLHNKSALYLKHNKNNEETLDDLYFYAAVRLNRYNHNLVTHTEEVIIRGPVSPKRITIYQSL